MNHIATGLGIPVDSDRSENALVRLLQEIEGWKSMSVKIRGNNELAVGTDMLSPKYVIDFSKEEMFSARSIDASITNRKINTVSSVPPDTPRNVRRSGDYWFEIKGRRTPCRSLKELLALSLCSLENGYPGTLEKLSRIQPRSKRIVARRPEELFGKDHLVGHYAEQLMDGWWYGTNNSAGETNAWLERACSCSGLAWREDSKTSLD